MNYDLPLFLEIIESVPGISFLRRDSFDGVKASFYQGMKGNLVQIDTTDEDLTDELGKAYLRQLGIPEYIPALFPEKSDADEVVEDPNESLD